jgi:hypothetical protein
VPVVRPRVARVASFEGFCGQSTSAELIPFGLGTPVRNRKPATGAPSAELSATSTSAIERSTR